MCPAKCCMFDLPAVQQYLSKWGQEGVVDLKDEFSQLVALTAARTLLGKHVGCRD